MTTPIAKSFWDRLLVAVLMLASLFVLSSIGFIGDEVIHYIAGFGGGIPLPPPTEWLIRIFGIQHQFLETCWSLWLLLLTAWATCWTFSTEFYRNFYRIFVFFWAGMLIYFSIIGWFASLPFVSGLTSLLRPPTPMMTANEYGRYAIYLVLACLLILKWNRKQKQQDQN